MAKKKQGPPKPNVIVLEPRIRKYLRGLRDKRAMTQRENDIVAGIAFALDIDNAEYTYDDLKIAFVKK